MSRASNYLKCLNDIEGLLERTAFKKHDKPGEDLMSSWILLCVRTLRKKYDV